MVILFVFDEWINFAEYACEKLFCDIHICLYRVVFNS